MNTTSRGDWSRSSVELCKEATLATLHLRHLTDDDDDDSYVDADMESDDLDQLFEEENHHRDDEEWDAEGRPLVIPTTSSTASSSAVEIATGTASTQHKPYGSVVVAVDKKKIDSPKRRGHRHHKQRRESISDILMDELTSMVKLAIPVIGTYLLEMLPGIVSIILVGHVKVDNSDEDSNGVEEEEDNNIDGGASSSTKVLLDAAALAVMYMNLTGLSVGFGLTSAMDTLCSQAYGASETMKMGIYFQTGCLVLLMTYAVVFVVNYYATPIFILLGQPLEVAELAGTFALWLLPGIPFLYVYELIRKVLQAQNVAVPMFYVAIVANFVNVLLGYHLTYLTSIGWLGAAIARTVCNVSFLLFMILYLLWSDVGQLYWKPIWGEHGLLHSMTSTANWSAAYKGVPQFIELGVPGALQLCFEWWAFEIIALICGLLPNSILAIGANAIILNIASMVYMFYLGVSISVNVRIGNALGGGLAKRAKLASELALGMSIGLSLMCACFIIAFRTTLPALFTHDEEIIKYCSQLMYIVAMFQLPDSMNGTIQGIFRGSGRQSLGAYLNFLAYYGVGMPIGVFLAFHYHYSVEGLWIGMTFGLFVIAAVGTFVVQKSNWEQLATDAISRLNE